MSKGNSKYRDQMIWLKVAFMVVLFGFLIASVGCQPEPIAI